MSNKIANLFVAALLCLISACSNKENQVSPTPISSEKVLAKDGYLVFNSYADFNSIREGLASSSRESLDQWESRFSGFESQRFLFEQMADKDVAHKESLNALSAEQIEKLKNQPKESFYYDKAVLANKHLLNLNEEGISLKIQGNDPDIERFVNKDGLIQIGDSIFQYKGDYIKIIRDGDFSKVSTLDQFTESSREQNLMVIKVNKRTLTAEEGKNLKINFNGNGECLGYAGSKERVKGVIVIREKYMNDIYGEWGGGVVYQPYCYMLAENHYKGVFGWETKRTSGLRIVGTNLYFTIFGQPNRNNFTIDKGTGGSLEISITYWIYMTDQWYRTPHSPFSFSGNATFYGRSGSQCSL